MKKYYIMAVIGLSFLQGTAQEFFFENFGTFTTSDQEVNINDYTGFQYTEPVSYNGTAKVSGSLNSIGYPAASGFSNIHLEASTNQFLTISGINTSGYSSETITLFFGYYKETPSDADVVLEYSTNGLDFIPLEFNRLNESGWELVVVNDVVPSVSNLSVRFSQTSDVAFRIDDLRFKTSSQCPLSISTIYTNCNENTDGVDTYTVNIPFNGGGTQSYGITSSVGTIAGDDPSTQQQGVLQIINVNEGRDLTFNIVGNMCDYSSFVAGPQCKPEQELPFYESFNYPAGSNLVSYSVWASTSNGGTVEVQDESLISSSMHSDFNSLKLNRSGRNAYVKFTPVASNRIYSSFIFNVESLDLLTAEGESTIVVALSESQNFALNNLRMYIQRAGEGYKIGLSSRNDAPVYSEETYNLNENLFIILGYDFNTNSVMAWVNADVNTINDNTTPTVTTIASVPADNFGSLMLYQNGIVSNLDELKIGTTLAEVTTSVLSNKNFNSNGFTLYPNPLTGDVLNIQTANNGTKSVLIYDMMGKQVFTATTASATISPNLSSGLYMVKITENNVSTTQKLIVK